MSMHEMIWLCCRPPEAKPAGLGMRFADVIELSPRQMRFLLSDRREVQAMAARSRKLMIEASGKGTTMSQEVKRYQDDRREAVTGSRVRPRELDDKAERDAIKAEMKRRRKAGKTNGQG